VLTGQMRLGRTCNILPAPGGHKYSLRPNRTINQTISMSSSQKYDLYC